MSVNIKKEFGGAKNRRPDLTTLVYGKVPPQAPDLEEAVIGACMLEKDTFAQVLEIIQSEECFYVDAHQKIYAAMRRLFDKGIPVDLLTITDELRDANELEIVGGAYYLTRLTMSVLTSAHVEAHARIVMEKFIQRELIRISGNIIGDAYEDSSDVFDLLDKAESNLYEITDKHLRKNFRSLKDVMVRTIGEIEESMKKTDDLTGVPSGFAALDRITGGWQRSDLIILAARPSVGKTALCLNIAMNAAMNAAKEFPVAIFSLEMGAGQIVRRMLSAVTEVSMESITRGKMSDGEFMQMTQRMEKLSKAKIFIDDQAALNIFELRAKARRLKQKHGIELIVIDYLQLMQGSVEKSGNREQEISKISRDLKALAKELDIPIIALSQLNRSVETRKESKMPQLSDLRECLSVETSNIYTSRSFQANSHDDMDLLSLHDGKIISTNSHNIEKTKNEVFRLKTQSGRFVDATAKHKILTSDGYKKLGEINNTDSVAIALNWTNPEGVYIPQAKFIGWMLGNGSMLASHAPAFITRDPIIGKNFVSFIEKEFGFKPKPHKHHKSKVFQYDVVKDSVRTSEGNPATKWLRERQMWGYTAKDKKIPDWLLAQADEKSICELLQGLWETDGSIEIGQKGKKRERISYSTTSLLLANQMLYLLAKLGIIAFLDNGHLSKKATTKCYKLIIEGEEKNKFAKKISLDGYKGEKLKSIKITTRQSYLSNVLSRSTTLEIHANVKFVGITKRLVQIHGKRRLTKASLAKIINCHPFIYEKYNWLLSDGIYWDKVDSIESMGVVEVFDRNVPVAGNFVVNGIAISNSGALEQDADLVMFLYRPEYYGINNDAMGETVEGETHINIAKHRNGSTGIEKLRFIKEYQKFVDFDDDQFGGFNDGGFAGNPGRDPRAGGDATVGSFLKGGGNSNPYAGIRRDPSEFGGSKMFVPGGFQTRPSAANDVNWDDDSTPTPVRKTPPDEDVPF